MPVTISVDGPSASGKGTISQRIASHFGYHYLDTGLLYRAVGLKGGDPIVAAKMIEETDLLNAQIRSMEAASMASVVAAIPEVREALLEYQRSFSLRKPGAVLDGRDIGTVVCPWANIKLFIDANLEIRAKRRADELSLNPEAVLIDLSSRDRKDSTRSISPLCPAEESYRIDTSFLTPEEAVVQAINHIEKVLAGNRSTARTGPPDDPQILNQ